MGEQTARDHGERRIMVSITTQGFILTKDNATHLAEALREGKGSRLADKSDLCKPQKFTKLP